MSELSMKELVAEHNKLARAAGLTEVKRFKSKAAAVEAINQLEARKGEVHWPFAGKIKHNVRPHSLQGKFVAALQKGATMNALIKLVEAHDAEQGQEPKDDTASRARSTMRMLHRYNGYGVDQVGNKFHLVEA